MVDGKIDNKRIDRLSTRKEILTINVFSASRNSEKDGIFLLRRRLLIIEADSISKDGLGFTS